jgi:LysM repeat protein
LYELIKSDPKWLDNTPLILPAPHRAGTATDAAGRQWLKRAIALQTLTKAAQQLSQNRFEARSGAGNAFLHALTAREAARLGLELPEAIDIEELNLVPSADALWALNETELWSQPADRAAALRGGLMILNRLLRDQPAGTEAALFHALRTNDDPWDWLIASLGRTRDELQAKLWEVGASQVAISLPFPPPDLALSCKAGPALLSLEERQLRSFIAAPFLDARPISWSPDGKRLALGLSGQTALLDFESVGFAWLPSTSHPQLTQLVDWALGEVAAYLVYTVQPDGSVTGEGLKFFDSIDPQREFPIVSGVRDYVLSPDGTQALVTGAGPEHEGELGVMPVFGPAPGSEITWLGDTGLSPAWSPDGRSLAYIHLEEDSQSYSVRVAVLPAESASYVVQPGDTLWDISLRFNAPVMALMSANRLTSDAIVAGQKLIFPIPEAADDSPVFFIPDLITRQTLNQSTDPKLLHLVWSPALDQLALVAPRQDGTRLRVLLISSSGFQVRLLLDRELRYILSPQFSADGKYLAVSTRAEEETADSLLIYDATTRTLARALPETLDYAWSPTGHELAILGPDGVYLTDNPGSDRAAPLKLADGHCDEVMWRP